MDDKALIVFYRKNPQTADRFDDIITPYGGLAAVGSVAKSLKIEYRLFDESYPYHSDFESVLFSNVEKTLREGKKPYIFGSILFYNSEQTIKVLQSLKKEFGSSVVTGIGGQASRFCGMAYANYSFLDKIGIGDAEFVLEKMLFSEEKVVEGAVKDYKGRRKFAPFDYTNYVGIHDRLKESEQNLVIGKGEKKISSIRQVVMERVRGCAWAASNLRGACSFCSLPDVEYLQPKTIDDYLKEEMSLVESLGVNWIFDISDQWLPFSKKESKEFLTGLIASKKKLGDFPWPNKYVYISSYSIDDEICRLLSDAGVRAVFVGLEHFSGTKLKEMNKGSKKKDFPHKSWLDALKRTGIKLRTAIVLGDRETSESAGMLEEGLEWLCSQYSDILLSVHCATTSIFPGSKDFEYFKRNSENCRGKKVLHKMEQTGVLTWGEQLELDQIYTEEVSSLSFSELETIHQKLLSIPPKYGIIGLHSQEQRFV